MRGIGSDMMKGVHKADFARYHSIGTAMFKEIGLNGANLDPQYLLHLAHLPSTPLIIEEDDFNDENNPNVNKYMHVSDLNNKIEEFITACGY